MLIVECYKEKLCAFKKQKETVPNENIWQKIMDYTITVPNKKEIFVYIDFFLIKM